MSDEHAPADDTAEHVDQVLAVRGHRARMRLLATRLQATAEQQDHAALQAELVRRVREVLRSDPREAGRRAQLALAVAERRSDDAGRIEALTLRAKAAITGGRFDLASDSLDAAVQLARSAEDDERVAEVELLRVHVLPQLGRHTEATAAAGIALAHHERRGNPQGQALAHMALGDLEYRADRPRRSLHHYRQVARLLPAGADRMQAALACNRANALEACNRFRAATRQFDRSLGLFVAAGCDHTGAQVEYNLAYAELLRGRYTDSLRRLTRLEDTFRRLDDERHLAHVCLDKAEIHVHLNLPAEATQLAATAESRFEALGLSKERAQAARLHGRALELLGKADAAADSYARAEEQFLLLGLGERAFTCRIHRACLAEQGGRRGAAAELAEQADELLGDDGGPVARASAELLRARLRLADGDVDGALVTAQAVRTECRRIHAPWIHIEAARTIGRAHTARGALDDALLAFKDAVERLERYRGGVPADEYMTAFLAARAAVYHEAVDILVRRGDIEEAFGYAEGAKSRALDDLLMTRHDAPLPTGLAGPSARRLRHLREQLHTLYQRLFQRDGDGDVRSRRFVAEARAKAGELESEVEQLLRRSRLERSSASTAPGGRPLDIARLRAALGPDDAYLSYLVTDDQLFVFVLTRTDAHVVRTPTHRADLERRLSRFRYHLNRATRVRPGLEDVVLQATRANLRELSDLLVAPVLQHLGSRRVVVVAGSPLQDLPFHALPSGEGWLGEDREVVYAPSATIYARCVREGGDVALGRPAVFALPDELAPRIADEAQRVGEFLGARSFHGEEATFDRLRESAAEARVVHVATHGMFRAAHPTLSSIRLADRWVNLYDLYDLRFRGELVVLASCESGTAEMSGGDEVIGLTRGLLYAGAPAVLTSQWTVDDAAAAAFMDTFYAELESARNVMSAYRAAMAAVRLRYPHPYYWAPFFVTGRPIDPIPDPIPDPIGPIPGPTTTETDEPPGVDTPRLATPMEMST